MQNLKEKRHLLNTLMKFKKVDVLNIKNNKWHDAYFKSQIFVNIDAK